MFSANIGLASSLVFLFNFYSLKKPGFVFAIIILKNVSHRFLLTPLILPVKSKAGTLSNMIPLVLRERERGVQMSNSLYLFRILTFHKVLTTDKH